MIRLINLLTDKPVWVNPEHIVDIGAGTREEMHGTWVSTVIDTFGEVQIYVKETPEEVARKVLEYKLAMVRYGKSFADVIREDNGSGSELDASIMTLNKLVGLEEQKDE